MTEVEVKNIRDSVIDAANKLEHINNERRFMRSTLGSILQRGAITETEKESLIKYFQLGLIG